MAKDKRHSIGSDMNALNLNDASALTDQEREQLQMSTTAAGKKSSKRKKAM